MDQLNLELKVNRLYIVSCNVLGYIQIIHCFMQCTWVYTDYTLFHVMYLGIYRLYIVSCNVLGYIQIIHCFMQCTWVYIDYTLFHAMYLGIEL